MQSNGQKLLAYWKADGVPILPGAKLQDLEDFEKKYLLRFPNEFREYLLCVNGMNVYGPQGQDSNVYAFWPLPHIISVPEEAQKHSFSEEWASFPDAHSYFVFADYFQWSWAIAIRLSANQLESAPIFLIGKQPYPVQIAASFSEFVELYLIDSPALYGSNT